MTLSLVSEQLHILIGQPPPTSELTYLQNAFITPSLRERRAFRQVVTLSSQNLIQLTNFIRRCRKELASRKRFHYLVFLYFTPHREAVHFLRIFRELACTVIVLGGVCTDLGIRELFDFRPHTILEWHQQVRIHKQPLLCMHEIVPRHRTGLVHLPAELQPADVHTCEYTLGSWQSTRHPETFSQDHFTPATHTPYQSQPSNTADPTSKTRKAAISTQSMTLLHACTLLNITESEAGDADHVRRVYRKLALKYHPDKQRDPEQREAATKTFAEITIAKTVIDHCFDR